MIVGLTGNLIAEKPRSDMIQAAALRIGCLEPQRKSHRKNQVQAEAYGILSSCLICLSKGISGIIIKIIGKMYRKETRTLKELFTYTDPKTGYEIRQYTKGPARNTKLYFTTENFSTDDQFFFFNRQMEDGRNALHKAHVETGEIYPVLSGDYAGFAMSRDHAYGVMTKGDRIYRYDCLTDEIVEIGGFPHQEKQVGPSGGRVTGHLTTTKNDLVVYSYQQRNCIFALVVLDPKTGKSEIVHQSDYHLGHTQACPGDDNTIFYIHETGGDALQRMWMFDLDRGACRPYFIEQDGDWITHEVWSVDGQYMIFMKYPHYIMIGTKDGHNFRPVTYTEDQFLHPGVSRDMKWFCADRCVFDNMPPVPYYSGIWLINGETGAQRELAQTGNPIDGGSHAHPSFNRKGDQILFSNPDLKTGVAQVAMIDLKQVERP